MCTVAAVASRAYRLDARMSATGSSAHVRNTGYFCAHLLRRERPLMAA